MGGVSLIIRGLWEGDYPQSICCPIAVALQIVRLTEGGRHFYLGSKESRFIQKETC